MIVRAVRPSDAKQWATIFEQYRQFDRLPPDPAVVAAVWDWLMNDSFNLEARVAEEGTTIVGMALFRRFPRPATATMGIYLDDLYVASSSRGRGYAQQLITAIADIATDEDATVVRWICANDNPAAQRLYDRIADRSGWITYDRPTSHS